MNFEFGVTVHVNYVTRQELKKKKCLKHVKLKITDLTPLKTLNIF